MSSLMDDEKSCYVTAFNEDVTEDLIEELFTQVGPVTKVLMKSMKDATNRYALVEFEDEESVLFAIETLNGIKLFNTALIVKPRNGTNQEQLYRQKKAEIDRRQQLNLSREPPKSYPRESHNSYRHTPPQPYAIPKRNINTNYTPQSQNFPKRQYPASAHRQDYSTPKRYGNNWRNNSERGRDEDWRSHRSSRGSFSNKR